MVVSLPGDAASLRDEMVLRGVDAEQRVLGGELFVGLLGSGPQQPEEGGLREGVEALEGPRPQRTPGATAGASPRRRGIQGKCRRSQAAI